MQYRIATGKRKGEVRNHTVSWQQIVAKLSQHKQADKKGGEYLIGGAFKGTERKEDQMLCRSLITIDIDKFDGSISELEFGLQMSLDCAFIAYSTYSHTPDAPRVRVVVPMSREVTPAEYREASREFAKQLDGLPVDPCSFVPNEAMYLPTCPDLGNVWSLVQDGEPWAVPDGIEVQESGQSALEDALDDQPSDLSDEEVDAYLAAIDPELLEYDEWFKVGAALHHQFQGAEEGYCRWVAWSLRSSKHDETHMRTKWKSCGRHTRKVKMGTVIMMAKDAKADIIEQVRGSGEASGVTVDQAAFEKLAEDASAVCSVACYDRFKLRLQGMSLDVVPMDKRAMLAQEIHGAWGGAAGLTRSDIKRELKPIKKAVKRKSGVPSWVEPWAYVQATCEFYHTVKHYAIKREAFNMTYGREQECLVADTQASLYAMNDCQIDTVVDTIFWPGADAIVEYEDKRFINVYRPSGITPCDALDDEGQRVVDMFLDHVRFMIADPKEQRLLIDSMAWIVQNPGHKMNWAVLMQGPQGVGKSYFGVVMQNVLGQMAKNVEPSALAGRFTSWAHGALLVVVEEIRVAGENRFEIIDRLKPFISNATIQIEEKGRDHRTVPNFTSYMFFTNHKDALPLDDGDRRYAPIFSRVQSKTQMFTELGGEEGADAYFTRLFKDSERRADALSRFLHDWQISPEFNAKGRAPNTTARQEMLNLAISPERSIVEDAIDLNRCDVINDTVVDVTWLNELCVGEGQDLPKTRALSAILLEMGYSRISTRKLKISRTAKMHYVWFKGDEEAARNAVRRFHKDVDIDPHEPPF